MMMYRDVQRFRAALNFKIIKINTKTHQIWWVFYFTFAENFCRCQNSKQNLSIFSNCFFRRRELNLLFFFSFSLRTDIWDHTLRFITKLSLTEEFPGMRISASITNLL